jgi:Ca-activated chloride channel homolog
VSFAAPLVLLGLLGVPALAFWYAGEQRRRRRAAAAFAPDHLLPSVAPHRPGWRRHAPLAVLALALAFLVVAAARPQRTVAVPVEEASIMLVTDVSGSMEATDVAPSRLVAARRAAAAFVARVPRRVQIGVMAFNATPRVLQSPTTDRAAIDAALRSLRSSGGTATGNALASAVKILRRQPGAHGKRPPAAIVLLSDGTATSGVDPLVPARAARRLKIPVYTVSVGTSAGTITVPRPGPRPGRVTKRVPPDPRALGAVARAAGGQAFTAQTTNRLSRVYERLGSQLGHRHAKRQITSGFAGGGLVLLLLGCLLSLRWFGRPI